MTRTGGMSCVRGRHGRALATVIIALGWGLLALGLVAMWRGWLDRSDPITSVHVAPEGPWVMLRTQGGRAFTYEIEGGALQRRATSRDPQVLELVPLAWADGQSLVARHAGEVGLVDLSDLVWRPWFARAGDALVLGRRERVLYALDASQDPPRAETLALASWEPGSIALEPGARPTDLFTEVLLPADVGPDGAVFGLVDGRVEFGHPGLPARMSLEIIDHSRALSIALMALATALFAQRHLARWRRRRAR